MKLITLHQPWASLIALGIKEYETRNWNTPYRGEILIHAAKKTITQPSLDWFKNNFSYVPGEAIAKIQQQPNYGCVVAHGYLADCLQMTSADPQEGQICIYKPSLLEQALGCWDEGRYALRLEAVTALQTPIPFTSRQGTLLDAPPALALMVRNQLQESA